MWHGRLAVNVDGKYLRGRELNPGRWLAVGWPLVGCWLFVGYKRVAILFPPVHMKCVCVSSYNRLASVCLPFSMLQLQLQLQSQLQLQLQLQFICFTNNRIQHNSKNKLFHLFYKQNVQT